MDMEPHVQVDTRTEKQSARTEKQRPTLSTEKQSARTEKQRQDDAELVSGLRAILQWPPKSMRNDVDTVMETLLFNDDDKGEVLLKHLITTSPLQKVWGDTKRRLEAVEASNKEIINTITVPSLERHFVTLQAYNETVEGKHAEALCADRRGIQELEKALAASRKVASHQATYLDSLSKRIEIQEQAFAKMTQNIERIEKQSLERDESCIEMHNVLKNEGIQKDLAMRKELKELNDFGTTQMDRVKALHERVDNQQAFLDGESFTKHIRHVCNDILQNYVPLDRMKDDVAHRAIEITQPMQEHLTELDARIEEHVKALSFKDKRLGEELTRVDHRLTLTERTNLKKLNDMNSQILLRATIAELKEVDGNLMSLLKGGIQEAADVKRVSIMKMQEIVHRLSELQAILADHEHALQHHAEELLNRSTKYDLVVFQQRLDRCALRDKVEKEMCEMTKTLSWASSKLEEFSSNSGWGLMPDCSRTVLETPPSELVSDTCAEGAESEAMNRSLASTDFQSSVSTSNFPQILTGSGGPPAGGTHGTVQEPSPTPNASRDYPPISRSSTRNPSATSGRKRMRLNSGTTETFGLFRQQLEATSQALLVMGTLVAKHGGALSREMRLERESALMHNLSCIVHWITHRASPADFDPLKLETLALQCRQPPSPEHAVDHEGSPRRHSADRRPRPRDIAISAVSERFSTSAVLERSEVLARPNTVAGMNPPGPMTPPASMGRPSASELASVVMGETAVATPPVSASFPSRLHTSPFGKRPKKPAGKETDQSPCTLHLASLTQPPIPPSPAPSPATTDEVLQEARNSPAPANVARADPVMRGGFRRVGPKKRAMGAGARARLNTISAIAKRQQTPDGSDVGRNGGQPSVTEEAQDVPAYGDKPALLPPLLPPQEEDEQEELPPQPSNILATSRPSRRVPSPTSKVSESDKGTP